MSKINDIESKIHELIRVNEKIVTNYDSDLLCSDWDNSKNTLKKLLDEKKDIIESLEDMVNNFFNIKQNFITKKIKITSFHLVPSLINHELMFFIPKTVDRFSKQYFCYIALMDRLSGQYDSIFEKNGEYYILDISSCLNLEKLLEGDMDG